jgi:ureidoglycolate lyase
LQRILILELEVAMPDHPDIRINALAVERLTKAAFAPFGDVVEIDGAEEWKINQGYGRRFADLARIEVASGEGRPMVSIVRARQWPLPLRIKMLERHPLGSQCFYPLSRQDWVVVVAEGAKAPDLATLRCFLASSVQGVNYRPNVWHHPLLPLAMEQDFICVDRAGSGSNLEEAWLPQAAERIIQL